MKVVLAGYGTRGDTEPFAAVGRELLRRGHDVCMAVAPEMVGFLELAELDAVPFGPESLASSRKRMPQAPVSGVVDEKVYLSRAMEEWGTTLTALVNGADLLVTGRIEQGLAANVAEYYDIPQATLQFFPGAHSRLSGWAGDTMEKAEDAHRRALGQAEVTAPPTRSLEIQAYDALFFPELAAEWAHGDGWRPFVGALTMELPTEADDEVASWIAAGTPPIYFGFGSTPIHSASDTIAMIAAACTELGERALIYSGASGSHGISNSDNVKLVGPVNYAAIFPSCRAVVHHGGAGTTAAGLRAGVPMLVLWDVADQPLWGAQVTRMKVGRARRLSAATPESLVADLREIFAPQYVTRACEIATRMAQPAESVTAAADLLEGTARRRRVN